MENPEFHHGTDMRSSYWDAQAPLFAKLSEGVSSYVLGIPDIGRAFKGENRKAACIDDRLTGNLRLAGLGILLPKEEARAILKQMKPEILCWHPGCGAAAAAYDRLSPEEQATYGSPDAYAKAFAGEMAHELGLPPAERANVEPEGFHPTRVVYYDGTGDFDPSLLDETMPPGFVVSRRYMDEELSKETVDFSLGIAIGDHGFGNRIGPGSEVLFIAIGNDSADVEKLKRELTEVASRHSGKAKVDGFVAPLR